RDLRAEHPDKHILFFADDDHRLEPRMRRDLREICGIELECDVPIDGKTHAVVVKAAEYRCTASYAFDAQRVQYLKLTIATASWAREIRYENAGMAKAHAAAAEVGNASVVCPQFASRESDSAD